MMELIYNNFDALDITFQGIMPIDILEQLAEGRERAQNERRGVLVKLGDIELPVMVSETGAKGGYRYRFDTGLDGETWFIAHSSNSKNWNIRVSVKSLALSLYGYEGCIARINARMVELGASGASRRDLKLCAQNAGKCEDDACNACITTLPLERISRVDYCFDFVMPADFEPDPKHFIAHQRAKKHVYGTEAQNYTALNGDVVNTIRIGEMPGRQAVIYNKTKELKASFKDYMWEIWDIDPKPFKEGFKQIWRVEIRAGKDELDKWGLKRCKDFEEKIGDVLKAILKAIRYTIPLKDDLNRSRWPMHPIWEEALNTAFKALEPYSTNALRENILEDYRENVINGYKERLIGNAIGLTAAEGRDISELNIVLEELQYEITELANNDINVLIKKHEKAEERFKFLN